MNPYFWFFSLCALLITPVSITTAIQVNKGVRHHTHIRVAGITLAIPRNGLKSKEQETSKHFLNLDAPTLLTLIRRGHIKRTIGVLKLEEVSLYMRISFADAALTAMSYAAVRTLFRTALACLPRASRFKGRVNMDFQGMGSEILIQCIFSTRLGMLITAVLRLGVAVIRERAQRLKTEEERYAAASH